MSVTGHIIGNWNLSGDVGESGGTNVVPNPPEEATDSLEKVAIDDVVYSITGEQEQADWDQADPTAVDYIKNKPTIPAAQVNSDWDAVSGVEEILNKPTLSAVATSGSYTDLTDTPTIPAAQVNSDWDAASGVAQILNKPTLSTVATSGDYDDLINKPTIPAAQVNSDWNAASGVAQILNKPTIPAAQVNSDWNAVSGVAEILNKPTIPAAQVNSDWDAASGVAEILNKPTLASVATSGDASDVSYDNTLSGMTATDVQDAVDELKSNLTDLETYSTTEKVIGTWIDGKPIYRKSYSGYASTSTSINIDTLANVDVVIRGYGWAQSFNDNSWGIPSGRLDGYNNRWFFNTNNGTLALQFDTQYDSGCKYTFTVEYTKTTD